MIYRSFGRVLVARGPRPIQKKASITQAGRTRWSRVLVVTRVLLVANSCTCMTSVSRQQIPSDGEHLACGPRHETIHLPCILIHLSRIEHGFQPARFCGQLEQPLPLVLRQRWLFRQRPCSVLCFALRLPLLDLGLFAGQGAGVVGEVVGLDMVGFNGVEEVVAGLGQEGVDGEIEEGEIGGEGVGGGDGVAFNGGERARWLGHDARAEELGYLVQERCDAVRVVDCDGELL